MSLGFKRLIFTPLKYVIKDIYTDCSNYISGYPYLASELCPLSSVPRITKVTVFRKLELFSSRAVVPKVCCTDPKGSATSPQGIRGHISVMAALNFTYSLK